MQKCEIPKICSPLIYRNFDPAIFCIACQKSNFEIISVLGLSIGFQSVMS